MAVIHISEVDATRDFAALLDEVRSGSEVVIESDAEPIAILAPAVPSRRTIEECIALLPDNSEAVIDEDFSRDVQAAVDAHRGTAGFTSMGLILDSSVLIAAERKGMSAKQALVDIAKKYPAKEIAMSVISVAELAHGIARSDSPARKVMRQRFLGELVSVIPVHPVSIRIALRAGSIDGENTAKGLRVPLADLLIGVTALELGYDVLTANPKDFRRIPTLGVMIA